MRRGHCRALPSLLLAAVGGCTSDRAVAAGALRLTPGYATVAPMGDGGTAYFTVRNPSPTPDTLRRAAVEGASEAVLHTMARTGGLMRMVPLAEPAIGPRDSLVLEPGGVHLMFSGLGRPLRIGDTVTVVLEFSRAGPVRLRLPVRPYGG